MMIFNIEGADVNVAGSAGCLPVDFAEYYGKSGTIILLFTGCAS